MPLLSSTTSRNKSVTLRRPTITHLLLRPVNLAVLAAGLAVGILLAALTTQPPLTASAQTSICGNDICEGPVEQPYNCGDCLPTCDGANWCTDGIGASPAGCPDYTEYDDWAYVPGVDYCGSPGCCVSVEGDDNPPVTTAILDGTRGLDDWFVSLVTVTLSVSDDWSGVFSTNLDGEPYTGPQLYDAEGATSIAYQSYDNAGNLEPLKTTTFYIDTVPSATTVVVPTNNSWVSGVVTIAGISTDATSGLAGVDVSFDQGLTWLPATGGEVWAYPWDTRTLGVNIIQVRGRDQAGNIETPIVLAVSIDNSGPFFEVGPFPGEYCFTCSGPLTFTMTAFDEQSRINNSAIVVKQNGKDVRVLKAPAGELRNTPVVWDGKDSQGQLVPPGDYQLLFYTANYAGMFGSFGSSIRVVDVLPAGLPVPAPVLPADPPDDAPWIVSSNPPTPMPFIPASGITSGPVFIAPQVAAVPQTGAGGSTSSLTGASGGLAKRRAGAAATGATALLLAAAAYIAAQQATGNRSLGKKLAELAGTWKPSAKPVAPSVGKVAPPAAPPPPPPRPRRLRWNEIPRVMPPPPPPPPAPRPYTGGGVIGAAIGALKRARTGTLPTRGRPAETLSRGKSSTVQQSWPGRGGLLGAFGTVYKTQTERDRPPGGPAVNLAKLGAAYGGIAGAIIGFFTPLGPVGGAMVGASNGAAIGAFGGTIASWLRGVNPITGLPVQKPVAQATHQWQPATGTPSPTPLIQSFPTWTASPSPISTKAPTLTATSVPTPTITPFPFSVAGSTIFGTGKPPIVLNPFVPGGHTGYDVIPSNTEALIGTPVKALYGGLVGLDQLQTTNGNIIYDVNVTTPDGKTNILYSHVEANQSLKGQWISAGQDIGKIIDPALDPDRIRGNQPHVHVEVQAKDAQNSWNPVGVQLTNLFTDLLP